jgi:hypothetical protein
MYNVPILHYVRLAFLSVLACCLDIGLNETKYIEKQG